MVTSRLDLCGWGDCKFTLMTCWLRLKGCCVGLQAGKYYTDRQPHVKAHKYIIFYAVEAGKPSKPLSGRSHHARKGLKGGGAVSMGLTAVYDRCEEENSLRPLKKKSGLVCCPLCEEFHSLNVRNCQKKELFGHERLFKALNGLLLSPFQNQLFQIFLLG